MSLTTPAFAQENPNDGYFASGYNFSAGGSIQLNITLFDDLARLQTEIRETQAIGFAVCTYVFKLEGNAAETVILDTAQVASDDCPRDFGLRFERVSLDKLNVTFDGAEFLETAEFVALLRPLSGDELYNPIEGLDVLGIKPGMKATEARAAALDMGFEQAEQWSLTTTGDGWKATDEVFVRKPAPNNRWYEILTLGLSAVTEDGSDNPVVTRIGRKWTIQAEENVVAATLENALREKYGPPRNPGQLRVSYDRLGNAGADINSCKIGSLQSVQYGLAQISLSDGQTFPGCGPQIGGVLRAGPNGLATSLDISVTDTGLVWDSFWRSWSFAERRDIQTLYEGMTATGSAPEL